MASRAWRVLPLYAVLASCNWIGLAQGALTYETLDAGEAGNVVITDSLAYATLGDSGLAVVDLRTGARLRTVAPSVGSESVDDAAIAGNLLFVLDARPPGHVSVLSLRDPTNPAPVSAARDVGVGPFSGVAARDGLCVVSGGTSQLTAWTYDTSGALSGPVASIDLGRGQPDVALGPRHLLYVSTHYWGAYFGLDIVEYDEATHALRLLSKLDIDGAGFTPGGAKPANFPIEIAVLDDSTLLLAYARGLGVIDVSNPMNARLTKIMDVGGRALNVDVSDRTALVSVAARGVARIDFTSNVPRITKHIELPPGTNPLGVALSRRYSVVAARNKGVLVLR